MPKKKAFSQFFPKWPTLTPTPKATLGSPRDQTGSSPKPKAPDKPWLDKIQPPILHGCFMAKANLYNKHCLSKPIKHDTPKIFTTKTTFHMNEYFCST